MPQKSECIGCGGRFDLDSLKLVNENYYCDECFNETFTYCTRCNELIETQSAVLWNDDCWCERCLENETFICEGCRERYNVESSYTGRDGYTYCLDCLPSDESDESDELGELDARDDEPAVPECDIPFIKTPSQTFKANRHKNFCGVEIECLNDDIRDEYFRYNDLIEFGFSQRYDGSLDNYTGVEFVSNPFNGDLLLEKINSFCQELKKRNYYVNKSCGLHIHIKVPNRVKFLKKVFVFYLKFEKLFFSMLPNSRSSNSYCSFLNSNLSYITPEMISECTSSADFQKLFYNAKSFRSLKDLKKQKYNGKRYSWINFHSLFYRGTLEIRSHSGTINYDKIRNWLLMHLSVLDFLRHIPFQTVSEFPVSEGFFLSLFDEELQKYISERWLKFKTKSCEDEN
jgi:Putative amidoligase enzyme